MMKQLVSGAPWLGVDLKPEQLDLFETYYDELIHWNSNINLTAITDYEQVQTRHFLDSLTAILAGKELDNACVIDIGSGAGFPGLPLKILYPNLRLTLLEATAKKTAFLKHLKSELSLTDVSLINSRAEEVAHNDLYREKFDIVLCRAVAKMATLAELTLPFLKTGGWLIAQKKGDIKEEIKQASPAVSLLGGRLADIIKVPSGILAGDRYLVIVEKVKHTPPEYPRRSGMPAKKPLL